MAAAASSKNLFFSYFEPMIEDGGEENPTYWLEKWYSLLDDTHKGKPLSLRSWQIDPISDPLRSLQIFKDGSFLATFIKPKEDKGPKYAKLGVLNIISALPFNMFLEEDDPIPTLFSVTTPPLFSEGEETLLDPEDLRAEESVATENNVIKVLGWDFKWAVPALPPPSDPGLKPVLEKVAALAHQIMAEKPEEKRPDPEPSVSASNPMPSTVPGSEIQGSPQKNPRQPLPPSRIPTARGRVSDLTKHRPPGIIPSPQTGQNLPLLSRKPKVPSQHQSPPSSRIPSPRSPFSADAILVSEERQEKKSDVQTALTSGLQPRVTVGSYWSQHPHQLQRKKALEEKEVLSAGARPSYRANPRPHPSPAQKSDSSEEKKLSSPQKEPMDISPTAMQALRAYLQKNSKHSETVADKTTTRTRQRTADGLERKTQRLQAFNNQKKTRRWR